MSITRTRSQELVSRAQALMPGGVNSPVRAFGAVGGEPVIFASARGAWMVDVDGNRYLDLVGSWGPMLLGHAHPAVLEAVHRAVDSGLSFGATCAAEVELAERISQMVPSVEMVRLVNSGTEATMSALRLARGATGRADVIKFEGCYHGHSDCLLAKAGSGAMTFGLPGSAGVPEDLTRHTIVLPYNDLDAVRSAFASTGSTIAAVIVEPVAGNMGCVPPVPGYLEGLRELTREHHSLLIFDEVMTGFRVSPGGAQQLYGIEPDLTCLGKIVGGGMPLAAYGGKMAVMEHVAPLGKVYQAGTLSGNPVAVAAGLATLEQIQADPGLYQRLEQAGARLEAGLSRLLSRHGVAGRVQRVGSMLTLFFNAESVVDYASASRSDTERFGRYFHGMLQAGVSLPPSQFEAAFLGADHGENEIDTVLSAADRVLGQIAESKVRKTCQ